MNGQPITVVIDPEALAKLRASFAAADAFAAKLRDSPSLAAARKISEQLAASPAFKVLHDPAFVERQSRLANMLKVPKLPTFPTGSHSLSRRWHRGLTPST